MAPEPLALGQKGGEEKPIFSMAHDDLSMAGPTRLQSLVARLLARHEPCHCK